MIIGQNDIRDEAIGFVADFRHGPATEDLTLVVMTVRLSGFESETVNTYEIGLKSTLADGRVSTNIATFFSDFKNIQIPGSVIVGDDFIGTTTNAGKAEIWGIEFEGKALLSDNLTANANVGYINADYKEFIVGGVNVADDRNFQNTPEWSLNASLKL